MLVKRNLEDESLRTLAVTPLHPIGTWLLARDVPVVTHQGLVTVQWFHPMSMHAMHAALLLA